MKNQALNDIVSCMLTVNNDDIQRVQTQHRMKLVDFWNIEKGDRVLEIGCGQGDTTAVLAHRVGKTGYVLGIDSAPPDFGSPVTLGAATEHLKKSKLGEQLSFRLETDLLSLDVNFPQHAFDAIVISHASWYFQSQDILYLTLAKLGKWGRKLCIAEWDTRPTDIAQLPHLLSILVQAQYESFKNETDANVRILITPRDWVNIVEKIGGMIARETSIITKELHDGLWETDAALNMIRSDIAVHGEHSGQDTLPRKFRQFLLSKADLIETARRKNGIMPLASFCLVADM